MIAANELKRAGCRFVGGVIQDRVLIGDWRSRKRSVAGHRLAFSAITS